MRASEKEEARARTMMNHGGDGPAATNLRRDPFKTSGTVPSDLRPLSDLILLKCAADCLRIVDY